MVSCFRNDPCANFTQKPVRLGQFVPHAYSLHFVWFDTVILIHHYSDTAVIHLDLLGKEINSSLLPLKNASSLLPSRLITWTQCIAAEWHLSSSYSLTTRSACNFVLSRVSHRDSDCSLVISISPVQLGAGWVGCTGGVLMCLAPISSIFRLTHDLEPFHRHAFPNFLFPQTRHPRRFFQPFFQVTTPQGL